MAIIEINSVSKYNIYILVAMVSKLFSDLILGLNPLNYKKPATLFKFSPILNNHLIFQNFLEFLGFFLGGIIILFLSYKLNKSGANEQTLKEALSKKVKFEIYFKIFLIGTFFSLNLIIRTFLYLNFLNLELWMLEIIFISFLSKKILKLEINRHKTIAMFIVVPLLIMEFISNSLPETNHSKNDNNHEEYMSDYNIFKGIGKKINYGFIPIIYGVYILATLLRDYSWVESKYLLDKKSISLFKILFFTGLIGLLASIISIFISSYSPCKTFKNVIKVDNDYFLDDYNYINLAREICYLQDYDEAKKTLKLYYDNIFLLIKEYKIYDKQIKKELFLVLPLYLIVNMIKSCSHMLMIKYLEGYNILISDNLYFFTNRLIVFIINKANEEYLTVVQFILMESLEIIYIISNLIYIEIIELKFCNLDYDLKKNIGKRGIMEYINEAENEEKNSKNRRSYTEIEISEGYLVKDNDFDNNNNSSCDDSNNN